MENCREASTPLEWSSRPSSAPVHPKPVELIERYRATDMKREAASEKVIEDLQAALQRSLYPMHKLVSLEKTFRTSASKFDATSQCLSLIKSKLDGKPNIAQVFVAGVAAEVFLHTTANGTPSICAALTDIVGSIRRVLQEVARCNFDPTYAIVFTWIDPSGVDGVANHHMVAQSLR
ncbi:hypothetical protein KP509_1Z032600 [Ceratopteris richardii]|nr:hypothetical protein KP509_1Z032600 [Ceratopteris richardii]